MLNKLLEVDGINEHSIFVMASGADLEKFCTNNDISTFVIDDMMYTKAE